MRMALVRIAASPPQKEIAPVAAQIRKQGTDLGEHGLSIVAARGGESLFRFSLDFLSDQSQSSSWKTRRAQAEGRTKDPCISVSC